MSPNTPPAQRRASDRDRDVTLGEVGRNVEKLTDAVDNLTGTLHDLAVVVAEHSTRLSHVERLAYGTAGAVVTAAAAAIVTGHIH